VNQRGSASTNGEVSGFQRTGGYPPLYDIGEAVQGFAFAMFYRVLPGSTMIVICHYETAPRHVLSVLIGPNGVLHVSSDVRSDSTTNDEVQPMIRRIAAMVLFVQDLPGSTAFYRDTFTLPFQGSDADSASFLLPDGLPLILLPPKGSADLFATEVNALKIEGGPRGLLAASVADVDVAYERSRIPLCSARVCSARDPLPAGPARDVRAWVAT
jgi:hypothetical protein